jgi:hypothetical protein
VPPHPEQSFLCHVFSLVLVTEQIARKCEDASLVIFNRALESAQASSRVQDEPRPQKVTGAEERFLNEPLRGCGDANTAMTCAVL